MESISKSIVAVGAITAFAIACGPNKKAGGPPYHAEVLTLSSRNATTPLDDPAQYELKKMSFKYLENIDHLTSRYFNFLSGGEVIATVSYTGNIRAQEIANVVFSHHDVSPPSLQYTVKDNTVIPRDNYSLFALSCAYQVDSILSELEALSGVTPEELTRTKGKFTIYFNSKFTTRDEIYQKTEEAPNASYVPGYYSFVTHTPSDKESIPLSSNLKVMAHEFGHLIFHYLGTDFSENENSTRAFMPPKTDKSISGINEGFADLTSFTYTGIPNILDEVFNMANPKIRRDESIYRQRNFSRVIFTEQTISFCNLDYYCYGILFANSYFKALTELGVDLKVKENRARYYKQIVNAIKGVGAEVRIRGLARKTETNPTLPVRDFLQTLIPNIEDTAFRDAFRTSLLENFDVTLR